MGMREEERTVLNLGSIYEQENKKMRSKLLNVS